MITVDGNEITARFDKFDIESYKIFLQAKHLPEFHLEYDHEKDSYKLTTPARFAHIFDIPDVVIDHGFLPLSDFLFDYQKFITRIALETKRYAIWADTGLGKTVMFLEFARQVQYRTFGKVLLIVPLNIIQQTIDESDKFFHGSLPLRVVKTRQDLKSWCKDGVSDIGLVNPEKFIPRNQEDEVVTEIRYCAGVVLDEASILKAGGGKIKWSLIKSCRGVEYKLACTATPAPNEIMEYASQGSFLEKLRNEGEILWTYFVRDKNNDWKVRDHAENAFYKFMSGWSVYLRSPKAYGFEDNLKNLPPPIIKEYRIPVSDEQRKMVQSVPDATGQLLIFGTLKEKLEMIQRSKYSQLSKGFIYQGKNRKVKRIDSKKPAFVVDLIKKEVAAGLQVLVWTVFDEESVIISELLQDDIQHEVLTGKIPKVKRPPIIEKFRTGQTDVLISKASLLGFGLNFQNCGAMIYSGFNDSFEQFYQSMRRAYRYGQTRSVRVHIPYIPELEGVVWKNILRKQEQFETDTARQEQNYIEAMKGLL